MADYRERFLIVTFVDIRMAPETIQPLFNTALDWLRFAPNCWILWTNKDPSTWYGYIEHYLGENGGVLIAELNLDETGTNYLGKLIPMNWKWIDKHRSKS